MISKAVIRSLVCLPLFLQVTSCGTQSSTRVLKLAHGLDVTHPVHLAMEHMAERLSLLSAGRMEVDIYPGGQLGEERELIELLQIGSLAMTKVSASPLESFVPEVKVFSIPYLFRDREHLWKVLNGDIGQRLLEAGGDSFLYGLCYYDAGPRSFYTREVPIHEPRDLRGLNIRVQKSITSHRMVQALGGAATPIDWGELYSALQQGVVDGAENNPPSFYLSRHYEVCRFYSLDAHTWVPDILLISTRIWEELTPREREWLRQAVDESVVVQRRLWDEATALALEEVQKAGVEIIYPDRTIFRDAVRELHDSFKGTPIYQLIREIEDIK